MPDRTPALVPNEALQEAMERAGITVQRLAAATDSDPKTVKRWLAGRVPHPRTRAVVAEVVRELESRLWPEATRTTGASAEVTAVYPDRLSVPDRLWTRILHDATERFDMLVYIGFWLTERSRLVEQMRELAAEGVQVRLLLGDPAAEAVRQRSRDEGIGAEAIPAMIVHALNFWRPLAGTPGVEIRLHDTVLYSSIYRCDDEMLVNPHVLGVSAPHAPVMHVRRAVDGGVFDRYAASFEAVWQRARPVAWRDDDSAPA